MAFPFLKGIEEIFQLFCSEGIELGGAILFPLGAPFHLVRSLWLLEAGLVRGASSHLHNFANQTNMTPAR